MFSLRLYNIQVKMESKLTYTHTLVCVCVYIAVSVYLYGGRHTVITSMFKTMTVEKITEGLTIGRDKERSRDGDLGHLKTKR